MKFDFFIKRLLLQAANTKKIRTREFRSSNTINVLGVSFDSKLPGLITSEMQS
jgi:hypothetical protein